MPKFPIIKTLAVLWLLYQIHRTYFTPVARVTTKETVHV